MTDFLIYLIKASIYLSVFYTFFLLLARRTTFFRFNRIVFLAGTILCMVLPLIDVAVSHVPKVNLPMNFIEARLYASQIASGNTMDGNLLYMVLCAIYLSGVAVVVLITAASFVRMWQYIYTVPPTLIDDFKVRIVDMDTPSFSWGRNIVISRKDVGENPDVLIHEKMHAGCLHSLDLTLFSFVVIVHWFNPLVWITRGELKMLHEYEADKLTIDSGIDASQYQLLLVKKAVGEKRFHMANGFNHSKLKTRIKMIGRSDTKGWVRLAYILFIPLLFAVMCCCTQKSLNHGVVPLSEIYQHPIFEGGDANTFSRWVNQQLRYPKKCHDEKIQGRVTVQFTVNEVGKVCDVKVLQGVCEELDNEALRVIKKSPLWTPARMESGVAVPVSYTFPIMFMLREP